MQRIGLSRGSLCALLTASILVNLAGVTLAGRMLQRKGGIRYIKAKLGPKAVHTSCFNKRYDLFVLMPDSPDDVYFVGDSIVQAAEVGEMFGPCARNRGIDGDTTSGVLDRIDEIAAGRPREVHLMVGINDLQEGHPVPEVVERYRRIIDELRVRSPSTYLHIQSVLPICLDKYKLSILPDYPHITVPTKEMVAQLNGQLAQLAAGCGNLDYIDLSSLSDGQGWLRAEYTDDGLHLNGPGLVAWSHAVKGAVQTQLVQGQ